jgi:hypothetical protein
MSVTRIVSHGKRDQPVKGNGWPVRAGLSIVAISLS